MRSTRLNLETLENRWVPTTVSLNGNTLEIDGNRAANTVEIWQDDASNILRVRFDTNAGMVTRVFNSSQIRNIEVDLNGGADRLTYDLGANFTRAKDIEIEMDSGLDRVTMNMGQVLIDANGLPINNPATNRPRAGRIEAQLDIDIDSGDDADRVWVDFGPIHNATVNVLVDLDDGNDDFAAGIWGDLTGAANVRIEANGEDDNDIMRFAGRYDNVDREFNMAIGAQAVLTVDMDGGGGTDLVRANVISDLDGTFNLLLHGGSGNDRGLAADGVSQAGVSTSITLLGDNPPNPAPSPPVGSRGVLNARLYGDSGNDAMGFELINQSPSLTTIQNARLDGGWGTDNLLAMVSAGVTVVSVP
jgi:hypothetical protein